MASTPRRISPLAKAESLWQQAAILSAADVTVTVAMPAAEMYDGLLAKVIEGLVKSQERDLAEFSRTLNSKGWATFVAKSKAMGVKVSNAYIAAGYIVAAANGISGGDGLDDAGLGLVVSIPGVKTNIEVSPGNLGSGAPGDGFPGWVYITKPSPCDSKTVAPTNPAAAKPKTAVKTAVAAKAVPKPTAAPVPIASASGGVRS